MSEEHKVPADSLDSSPTDFQAIAALVRNTHHLDPEARFALVELLEELAQAYGAIPVHSEEKARLAESIHHVVTSVHEQRHEGLIALGRERVEKAIVEAESKAPFAAGIARRLLDAMANLGM